MSARSSLFFIVATLAFLPASRAFAAAPLIAEPWPEADALFHQDQCWLGSDDAYSLDLGGGRILWLFADTFVAEKPPFTRRHSKMIRNSVGIQRGADPVTAKMTFYWGRNADVARSFFAEKDGVWYWPGDAVMVDHTLLIFLMKVRKTDTGLKFEAFDWTAVAIDNPAAEPPEWHVRTLETPPNAFHAIVGSGAVLREGDQVYAYGSYEGTPQHDICLVRWMAGDVARGDLMRPEWWDAGRRTWVAQATLTARPAAVFTDAQTEFTVHLDPARHEFIEVQTHGFGAAMLATRTAPALTGPWSKLVTVYRPPEATLPGVMIYAGKAHPELQTDGLALTYVVNAGWDRVLDDPTLYYPRFVRLKQEPRHRSGTALHERRTPVGLGEHAKGGCQMVAQTDRQG